MATAFDEGPRGRKTPSCASHVHPGQWTQQCSIASIVDEGTNVSISIAGDDTMERVYRQNCQRQPCDNFVAIDWTYYQSIGIAHHHTLWKVSTAIAGRNSLCKLSVDIHCPPQSIVNGVYRWPLPAATDCASYPSVYIVDLSLWENGLTETAH